MDRRAWGIDDGYWSASGQWVEVPEEALDAVARSMGADGDEPPPGPPLWSVRAGQTERLAGPCEITLEDGTAVRADDALPPDLPPGYHRLRPVDGGAGTRLVVTPGRCHLPDGLRTWGWAVQLYAARSRRSWGIGDLGDLASLGRWASGLGAGVLALNPLHAAGPALPQNPSPYYPSSRRFRNPLSLRVEHVPGATDLERWASVGRALNDERLIDRDAVWRLKREALESTFARFAGDDRLDTFLKQQGQPLLSFATYCAIADEHGNGWPAWPAELHDPRSAAVARYAEQHAERVGFHAWLQWLLDEQLRAASAASPALIQDLAVGFDPGGADAWEWQDVLALDMRVGAPPDEFNTQGQDWGLPPFIPWKLRNAGFEPFVQTVRSALAHAGGLRVDHVMGLFRLFWIPDGGDAGSGTYVRYPSKELLDILALESWRAGAFVVGEDLGTVEDHVRADLGERQVLSYRLLWFEPAPPEAWPEQALAAVTTHDLPTIAGAWTGSDLEAQRSAGVHPNEGGARELRARLERAAGADDATSVGDVVVGTHLALAAAPSRVLVATLEDAMCVEERPNMPGTVDEWPNWSIALPRPIETLEGDTGAQAIARVLGDR